jgi:hypothetical protein
MVVKEKTRWHGMMVMTMAWVIKEKMLNYKQIFKA